MILIAVVSVVAFSLINLWLAFSALRFFITLYAATSSDAINISYSVIILIIIMSATAFYCTYFYFQNSRRYIYEGKLSKSNMQLIYTYCSLVTMLAFIIVAKNPWFLDIGVRLQYMEEAATVLRAIKILPIFLLALLIDSLNRNVKIHFIIALYILFVFIYGSKSGMIFLIIHIITLYHFKLIRLSFKNIILTILMFLLGGVALYVFFYFLAVNSGVSVSTSILSRLVSDTSGILMSVTENRFPSCVDYNLFNPFLNFIGKLGVPVGAVHGHLSFGNCLASPNDPSYPYEYLVPLIFELNYIYGTYFGSIIFVLLVMFHVFLMCLIMWILNLKRWMALRSSIGIYSAFSLFSIIFGGKFFNWFVSEYVTILFMITLLLILDYLLPKKQITLR